MSHFTLDSPLHAWFTSKSSILDERATAETEEKLQREVYGSKKASYARVEFRKTGFTENLYLAPELVSHSGEGRMRHYTRETLWAAKPGCLGQSPSGINPLTTAVKYALRAAQVGVENIYGLSGKKALTPIVAPLTTRRADKGPQFFEPPTTNTDRVLSSIEIYGRSRSAGCVVS